MPDVQTITNLRLSRDIDISLVLINTPQEISKKAYSTVSFSQSESNLPTKSFVSNILTQKRPPPTLPV